MTEVASAARRNPRRTRTAKARTRSRSNRRTRRRANPNRRRTKGRQPRPNPATRRAIIPLRCACFDNSSVARQRCYLAVTACFVDVLAIWISRCVQASASKSGASPAKQLSALEVRKMQLKQSNQKTRDSPVKSPLSPNSNSAASSTSASNSSDAPPTAGQKRKLDAISSSSSPNIAGTGAAAQWAACFVNNASKNYHTTCS